VAGYEEGRGTICVCLFDMSEGEGWELETQ